MRNLVNDLTFFVIGVIFGFAICTFILGDRFSLKKDIARRYIIISAKYGYFKALWSAQEIQEINGRSTIDQLWDKDSSSIANTILVDELK